MKRFTLLLLVAFFNMHISGYAQQNISSIKTEVSDESVYLEDLSIDKNERKKFNSMYQAIKYGHNIVMLKINSVSINGTHVTYTSTVVRSEKGDCNIGDNIIIHRVRETTQNRSFKKEHRDGFIYLSFRKKDFINYKKTNNEWEITNSHSYEFGLAQRALARIKKDFPQL